MRPFRYEVAHDPQAAVAMVAGHPQAAYLAGGTNLVDLMKLGVEGPELLVDITRLPLDRIERTDGGAIRIGAAVRNSDLAADVDVRRDAPVLAEAVLNGASGQLRNMATTGGNLLQRTRCLYFQDIAKPCNKREPGSGCPAREGEHRNLAILGASESCVATHPSDMAVALASLDAVVHIAAADGPREVPIAEMYRSPGEDPRRDTVLDPGSLITHVVIPGAALAGRSRYRKVRERASFAFAIASVAAVLAVDDGVVTDVRLALGAVAPMPWRARVAEEVLRGGPADEASFRRAIGRELEAAEPLRDNAYKVPLVANVVVRTLVDLATAPEAGR